MRPPGAWAPRAFAPRRRTPRRDGCNRGTCRSSRTQARAAPYLRLRRGRRGRHRRRQRGGVLDRANALERRLDGACVTADEHRALDLAAERRSERGEVLALAVAAGDDHERAGEAVHRGDGRAHIGALRVVDVAHAGDVGHPLGTMLQPRECLDRPQHRLDGQTRRLAESERRQGVPRIVVPLNFHACGVEQPLAAPRKPALRAFTHQGEICIAPLGGEGDEARRLGPRRTATQGLAHGEEERIVGIQHHGRRVRKDPRLRARVLGERGIAVHMVRADVEHHRAQQLERGRGFELEARQLEHI